VPLVGPRGRHPTCCPLLGMAVLLSPCNVTWISKTMSEPILREAAAEPEVQRPRRQKRPSYEPGHSPKLLVLVDDLAECEKAIYYASRRAARMSGKVVLLRVIEPAYKDVEWLGVAEIVRGVAREEAEQLLQSTWIAPRQPQM
jgi:hypothetical protein